MKRRDFLKTSLVASTFAAMSTISRAADAPSQRDALRQFFELRRYHLRRGPQQRRFDEYARSAAIPAMNRLGIGPVGVFNVMIGPDSPTSYVLLPYKSLDQFLAAHQRLGSDAEYQKAGAEFITAPPSDPPYVRMESSLMVAFSGMPRLELPARTADKKPRIFELRIYESHSRKAHQKKVEMFNIGEIDIFRRTGLTPVFFGETLIGSKLPNLTYMLTFENMEERDRNWGTFVRDPEWKKLSSTPGYTDPEIVSNISSLFLRPTAYSQI